MNKKLFLLPLLVFAIGLGAIYFWQQQQDGNENLLILYGNVDIREAQLAFNSSEHIQTIFVQEGDRVKKGQLLARLHTEVLQARLAEVEAQWEAQRQTLNKLQAGSRKEEISKARAELNAAKARATSARATYKRLLPMLKKKLVSPEDVENARAAADSAKAEMEAVKQALNLLELGPRKEDIAIAQAVLASRRAAVILAEQQLDDANLYAPSEGVIRNRILEPGDMAFPQTPALTLAFINPVWVRAYLPEPMLGKITLGSKAMIYSDSFPAKAYPGWVGYISPTAEFTPKNVQTPELRTRLVYSVRIFACNPQDELRLGMPATVHIVIDQPPADQDVASKNCER